jgi:competence protein ComEA
MVKWIIGAIVGVVLVVSAFMIIDPKVDTGIAQNSYSTSETIGSVNVSIDGAIVNSGTYTMKVTDTLSDLISKAGGLLDSADEDCFNESLEIGNYTSFYIPYVAGYAEECVTPNITKININTASEEELATINGITATLASRIVAYREANGDFQTLEEIQNVSGIGTKTYEKIRDYITLK